MNIPTGSQFQDTNMKSTGSQKFLEKTNNNQKKQSFTLGDKGRSGEKKQGQAGGLHLYFF